MTKNRNKVTTKMLDEQNVEIGGNIVVYDRASRKVLFYRRTEPGYRLILALDKRGKPITIRANDVVLSIDRDGTVIPGDAYGVFTVDEQAS